jgi:hypothetical protein
MRRRAFTLIETVLTLGVIGVIMLSLTSLMMYMGRAVPAGSDADVLAAKVVAEAELAAAEFSEATLFTGADPSTISFEIPDNTGDSVPEVVYVKYNAGDQTLLKSVNGGPYVVIMRDVVDFTPRFLADERSVTTAGADVQDPTTYLLCAYTGPAAMSNEVTSSKQVALLITPNLPSDATQWKMTRLRIKLAKRSLVGLSLTFALHLYTQGANPDASAALTSATRSLVELVSINTDTWTYVDFPAATWRSAGEHLWCVISTSALTVADVPYQANVGHRTKAGSKAASSWSITPDGACVFEAYGVIRRPSEVSVTERRGLSITLEITTSAAGRIAVTAPLRAEPVLDPSFDPGVITRLEDR